eukprot:TRINITY_DN30505_c0_g1_i1.p2 TRINITY_DN30505_c0_g1~~TRINITY_DN30505_c0_g1_i1.p2  ORF type:complete len:660 (+),score=285.96 TRINITY_DN30505_c0_g1_i1:86-2065(+)
MMAGGHPGFMPTTFVQSGRHQDVELAGRDRVKFFKRPVVPFIEQMTPAQAAALQPQIPLQTKPQIGRPLPPLGAADSKKQRRAKVGEAKEKETGTRDAVCQTDYRENECQTDPYTPDYWVEEGAQPQVLAIMELKYGAGLPAGLAEVEMIDRVKRRTEVEASLPQGGDDQSMAHRLQSLENLEQVEWNEREAHIKNLQGERLDQMAVALVRREGRRETRSQARIETVKRSKLEDAERKLNRMQEKRMTATRKKMQQHSNPSQDPPQKDIVGDYGKNGRRGKKVASNSLVEKMTSANYDVRPTLLGFPEGIQELERTKAPMLERVKEKDTKPPEQPTITCLENNYRKRHGKRVIRDLDFAQGTIDKAKAGKVATASIQDFYRATPRLVRPDTPTLVLQGDQDEEKEEALILLQRLLRGRAVQNEFFEGKERCNGLITELQAASKAKESEAEWKEQKAVAAYAQRQEDMVQGVIDQMQGDIIFGTLDYLNKELTRQRQAAKFDALRQQAETIRQQREEAEMQRRAQEEKRRRREDEQYRQLLDVTDYTVSTFLEQTTEEAIRSTAYERAVDEQLERQAKDRGEETARRAAAPEGQEMSQLDREQLVVGLMLDFVIPQVNKEREKRKGSVAVLERAKAEQAADSANQAVELALKELPKEAWK